MDAIKNKKLSAGDTVMFPAQFRTGELSAQSSKNDNTMTVSIASETPYRRLFGDEVLSLDSQDVDLKWFQSGNAPLLLDHDRSKQIGRIKNAKLDNGRLLIDILFSKRPEAQAELQDIRDGIKTNTSIGYQVREMVLEKSKDDGTDQYRVTDWQPLEASIVSVPADQTVGFNRDDDPEYPCKITNKREAASNNRRTITMLEDDNTISSPEKRVKEIMALGRMHEMADEAFHAIQEGWGINRFKDYILNKQASLIEQQPRDLSGITPGLDLSTGDAKQYNIFRAIEAFVNKDWQQAGFELECSRAIEQKDNKKPQGFFMPLDLPISQRDLTVGTSTAGGYLKGTDHRGDMFINGLYNALVLRDLGASVLPGLVGDLAIPGLNASTTMEWVAEGGAATEGAPTTRQVTMAPKTVTGYVDLSRKLRIQSSPEAEMLFRNDMINGAAVAVDAVGINGGGTNEPTGILQTSGIGSVAIGTNGGAPTWAKVVDVASGVEIDNAAEGALAYLTNFKVKGKMAKTAKVTSTDSRMILDEPFTTLYGDKIAFTNNVPSDLDKGTSSGVCSALIYGNFKDLIIGQWGNGMDILIDPYTHSTTGAVRISLFLDIDIAVRRAQSFAACQDLTTT